MSASIYTALFVLLVVMGVRLAYLDWTEAQELKRTRKQRRDGWGDVA
jgi:hypothetical protein